MFERLTLALCAVLAMVALAGGAPAQSVSEADATSFRQIISDHNGQVNAEVNTPLGTKIVIDLPLAHS